MSGAFIKNQNLSILLQGSFAGVLLGQMVHLFNYMRPIPIWCFTIVTFFCSVGIVLVIFRHSIQRYLSGAVGFVWLHFISSILCGAFLLLHLLPVLFHFEETRLIIYAYQLSSLLLLVLIIVENEVLHMNLLQNVYSDLFKHKRINLWKRYMLWGVPVICFALWSMYMYHIGDSNFSQTVTHTLYFVFPLFLLLLGVKTAFFRLFKSRKLYQQDHLPTHTRGHKQELRGYGNHYYIEKNLLKVLMEAEEGDKPEIYERIRQVPLIDKVNELESIRQNYLPQDMGLAYTIYFLKRLKDNLADQGGAYDIDSIKSIMEIRAYIRRDVVEGNPMLVQKLLNDNRPEVKKAAILATVYFNEASFIPALVNLLKDHEFAYTAKEALFELSDQCLPFLRSAKYRNKNNSFFIDHCLDLVESFQSKAAGEFLVEMFNEPIKEFQYKAAKALLKNDYPLSSLQKTQILHFIEILIGLIAMEREARIALEGKDDDLMKALKEEESEKMELVLGLLAAFLPGPVLEKVKALTEKDRDSYKYTILTLIDLFFPLSLRNKCKILLGHQQEDNIAAALQMEYLNKQIWYNYKNQEEAIRQILKMDYSHIGYWLRACALRKLACLPEQQVSLLMLSEAFNKNALLQEVALEVLYDINYDYYSLQLQRLPIDRAKVLKYKIENQKLQLLFPRLLKLRTFPVLKEYSYEYLSRKLMLFSFITFSQSKKKINIDPYKTVGYWIVEQGEFTLSQWGTEILKAGKGDIINMSFLLEAAPDSLFLNFDNEIKICFMEYYTFNKLYLKSGKSETLVIQPKPVQPSNIEVA